jgi:hypothetical protein
MAGIFVETAALTAATNGTAGAAMDREIRREMRWASSTPCPG